MCRKLLEGIVHLNKKIISSFIHLHVILNMWLYFFLNTQKNIFWRMLGTKQHWSTLPWTQTRETFLKLFYFVFHGRKVWLMYDTVSMQDSVDLFIAFIKSVSQTTDKFSVCYLVTLAEILHGIMFSTFCVKSLQGESEALRSGHQ